MSPYATLAKKAVEAYIKEKIIIDPSLDLPKSFFQKKAGVFVTIEKNKDLRGCIGTYLPTRKNIAEEIIYNAIAAAIEDYRFGPIQKEELEDLSYTVYILDKPELVTDIKKLDPKKYGIIVKTIDNLKTGLLLPDLEGVDTIEKQILIACQKAGINPFQEKIIIYKFTAKKFF